MNKSTEDIYHLFTRQKRPSSCLLPSLLVKSKKAGTRNAVSEQTSVELFAIPPTSY